MKSVGFSSLLSSTLSYARQIIKPRLILYLALFMVIGSSLVGIMNSGDGTQYALTKSLADGHTIYIDKYQSYTFSTDFAIGRDKHTLSDREPGPSFLAVPFYYMGKALDPIMRLPYDGHNDKVIAESKIQVVTYLSLVFIVSFGLVYAFDLLQKLGASSTASFLTCLLIGLGTLVWRYSSSFGRAPAVGVLLLLAVLQALSFRKRQRNSDLALVGVFCGVALLHDYIAAIPILLLMASILLLERPKLGGWAHLAAGFAPFVLVALVYNHAAFGELITSPHQHEGHFTFHGQLRDDFRTPLHLGLYLNLLSFGPIPRDAIQWVIDHKEIADQQGALWAMKTTYKGILVQSPFLVFALVGWVLSRRRLGAGLVYPAAIVIPWLILMSAYTLFWGPNTYDGRYILPLVPTLGAGLVFLIDNWIRQGKSWISPAATWSLAVAALISVYFAWESSVTNFSANLSGEHRWSPAELFTPIVTADTLRNAFRQSFPNVYNIHVLLGIALLLYAAAHLAPAMSRVVQSRTPSVDQRPGWLARFSSARPSIAGASGLILAIGVVALVFLWASNAFSNEESKPTPPNQAVQGTVLPGGEDRNSQRIRDLTTLGQLLQQYLERDGSYPSSSGAVQTLCVYDQLDAGCKLRDFAATLPADPLGNPLTNGYWYISDGHTFTLMALWEGTSERPADFPCPDTLPGGEEHPNRICLEGRR